MAKKAAKILGTNVLVLILILFGLNLLSVVIYQSFQGYQFIRYGNNSPDNRPSLPVYENISWARKHFEELPKVPSEYKSFVGWRMLPFEGDTINIDEEGIRKTPQHESSTENSPLVVFLGGSTMWGTGANDGNTIPAIFANESRGNYQVLNYGESAYTAFQSYLFLQLQINKGLKPSIIITYDGVNEAAGYRSELSKLPAHVREYQIRSALEKHTVGKLSFRQLFIGQTEDFISELKNKTSSGENMHIYDVSDERAERISEVLLDSWVNIKKLAENHGAMFIAILQPNAGVGNPNLEYLNLPPSQLEPYKFLYPMINKLLLSPKYEELEKHVIDLSNAFDGNEQLYVDYCHVVPNGNRIIAKGILEHLKDNLNEIED